MELQNQNQGLQMSNAEQTKYVKKMERFILNHFSIFCWCKPTITFAYVGTTEIKVKQRLQDHKNAQPILFNNCVSSELTNLQKLKNYRESDVAIVVSQLQAFLFELVQAKYPDATVYQENHGSVESDEHIPGNIPKLYIIYRQ